LRWTTGEPYWNAEDGEGAFGLCNRVQRKLKIFIAYGHHYTLIHKRTALRQSRDGTCEGVSGGSGKGTTLLITPKYEMLRGDVRVGESNCVEGKRR